MLFRSVEVEDVVAPRIARERLEGLYEEEEALDLLEWLHLLSLGSPRVMQGDDIDVIAKTPQSIDLVVSARKEPAVSLSRICQWLL